MTSNATIVLYIQSHLMKVGQVYYTYLGYLSMIAIMYKKSSWNTSISLPMKLGTYFFLIFVHKRSLSFKEAMHMKTSKLNNPCNSVW